MTVFSFIGVVAGGKGVFFGDVVVGGEVVIIGLFTGAVAEAGGGSDNGRFI